MNVGLVGRVSSCLLGLAVLALPAVARAELKDPSGTYVTEDGRARIRVEKCGPGGEAVCGYVVWLRKPAEGAEAPKFDVHNPNPAKTKRPLLGHQVMLGLQANSDDRYEGQIYNSDNGKSYDVQIWLDRPNRLKVRGCLVAPLCSTQNWPRTTELAEGELSGATGGAGGPMADPEWLPAGKARAGAPKRDAKPKS